MYKKILCVAAALAMVVGVFAGCGDKADKAAMDALTDQLETVTASYGGVADVVSQTGSVQQQEELDEAKAQLDEIAAKVQAGELTKDDAAKLAEQLTGLMTTIENIGEAANANAPEEDGEADALNDKLTGVATYLSGVYENVAANGTELQQRVIADAQVQVSEMAEGIDNGTYTAEDVSEALDFIQAVAQSVNETALPDETEADAAADATTDAATADSRDVNTELETLATLVSGAKENIDANGSQLSKDFIALIQDTVAGYAEKSTNGELTPEDSASILEAVDVLTEIVNLLNA